MKVTQTVIPDVLIIEPKVFGDERGSSLKASIGTPVPKWNCLQKGLLENIYE